MNDAAEEDLHAEDHEQLGLRPAVQLRRVRVDECEHDEPDADREQRLERRDEEVRAVLELVHRAEAEIEPAELEHAHQLPTAE